jgi:hypothetical protein
MYPARSVLTRAPEIGFEFDESITCPSILGLTGDVNGGTIMQDWNEIAHNADRIMDVILIFLHNSIYSYDLIEVIWKDQTCMKMARFFDFSRKMRHFIPIRWVEKGLF